MEAKLHESITEELNPLIEAYLKELGIADYHIKCVHLGNWIADFSQGIDESLKAKLYGLLCGSDETKRSKDFKSSLINWLEQAVEYFSRDSLPAFIRSELGKAYQSTNDTLNFLNEIIFKTNEEIERLAEGDHDKLEYARLGNAIVQDLKTLQSLFTSDDLTRPKFNSLQEIKSDPSIDCIQQGLNSLIRFLGLLIFKVGGEGEIDIESYNRITRELLNPYKPVHHLDRPFAKKEVIRESSTKQIDKNIHQFVARDPLTDTVRMILEELENPHPFDDIRGYHERMRGDGTGESPSLANDDMDQLLEAQPANFIAPYGYLKEHFYIAAGHLSGLEGYFKNLPPNPDPVEVNIKLAELGKTLHMYEDFFSHSNFVEFGVLGLYWLHKSKGSFKKQHLVNPLFNRSENNSICFNQIEVNRTVRSLVKLDKSLDSLDSQIATGYFGANDVFISLFHIAEGIVEENVSEASVTESPFKDFVAEVEDGLRQKLITEQVKLALKYRSLEALEAKLLSIPQEKDRSLARENAKHMIKQKDLEAGKITQDDFNRHRSEHLATVKKIEDRAKEEIDQVKELLEHYQRISEVHKAITLAIQKHGSAGKAINHFLDGNPPEYITENQLKDLLGPHILSKKDFSKKETLKLLRDGLNYFILARDLYQLAKIGKEYYEAVARTFTIIKIIMTAVRLIRLLMMYPREWLRLLYFVIGKLPRDLVEMLKVDQFVKLLKEFLIVNFMENTKDVFLRASEYRTGSHSLMAKDEKYEKPNLNSIGTRMAIYVDKVIIKNLLAPQNRNRYVDWYSIVPLYCTNYIPVNREVLPAHRLEHLRDPYKLVGFDALQRKQIAETHRIRNEKKSRRANYSPFDEKGNVCVNFPLTRYVPIEIKPQGESELDINDELIDLFGLDLIINDKRDLNASDLPSLAHHEHHEERHQTALEIEREINLDYLDGALTMNYLLQ